MPPPPKPLVAGALLMGVAPLLEANGFELPAVKLKPAEGGWGLKLALWVLAPKAGNEELTKELLGADD